MTLIYYFSKKSKGYLKSPSKLIVNRHVSSQSKRIFKVLSLTTITMTGVLFLLFGFYSIRTMIADVLINNGSIPIQVANISKDDENRIANILKQNNMNVVNMSRTEASVFNPAESQFSTTDNSNTTMVIMSKSQFENYITSMNLLKDTNITASVNDTNSLFFRGPGGTEKGLDILGNTTGTEVVIDGNDENRYIQYSNYMSNMSSDTASNLFSDPVVNAFVNGGLGVISDENYEKISQKKDFIPVTLSNYRIDEGSFYSAIQSVNTAYGEMKQFIDDNQLLNFIPLSVSSILLVYGLVQFLLLIIAIILIMTFVIILFFRAIESQELTKENYKIDSKLGMTNKDIVVSLCKENFNIFILPLILSSVLSTIAFVISMQGEKAFKDIIIVDIIFTFILPLMLIFWIIYFIVVSIGYRNIKRLKM